MLVTATLVLLLAPLCLCAGKEPQSEERLYKSKEWKDSSRLLIFTKQSSVPVNFLKALLDATKDSNVTHFKVLCPDPPSSVPGDICQILADHRVAIRVGGVVKGLTTPTKGYDSEPAFVIAVLKQLVASSITELTMYTDLTDYSSLHLHHLLLLEPGSDNEEYAVLLSAILRRPLPLAIAMTANVLPLSRRPHFSQNPPPLRMWYIMRDDSGEWWYPFHESGLILQDDINRNKPLAQLVEEFIERFQYPIIVHYENDATLQQVFSGSSLHLAVVFPGLSGASDIEPLPLAMGLAQKAFLDFAFVLADRSIDSEYCTRLYITDNKPLPQILLLPYGQENNFIGVDVDGQDLARETERVTGILDSFASDNPRSHGDHLAYSELGPSITDVTLLKALIAEKKHHILAYFCARETDECLNFGYSLVRDVLSVVRRTDLGRSLGAHVVQCRSVKDIKPPLFEQLPGCAVFNQSNRRWHVAPGDISAISDVLRFLTDLTGISELEELSESVLHGASAMGHLPPPPPLLQEEDQLNLVARSLKRPTLPHEIQLSSANFDQHVSKYLKTVVVFCVKWSVRCKVFLHHILAAHRQLDKALNASLAVVGCDEYTDLCTRFHITAFPTILLFTPPTIDNPVSLTGTLDSTHLLKALVQSSNEPGDIPLAELTSASLPGLLLGGGLERILVLWCGGDLASETAIEFLNAVSNGLQSDFQYAWINSTKHSRLVAHLLPTASSLPSVVAVNLQQRAVYHLPVSTSKQLKDSLPSFLTSLSQGSLEPSVRLTEKVWLPLQPPVPFPSPDHHHDNEDVYRDNYQEDDAAFRDDNFEFHFHDNHEQLHHHEPIVGHASNMPHPPNTPPPTGRNRHEHAEL